MPEECSICLEEIDVKIKYNWFKTLCNIFRKRKIEPVTTDCNHSFHKECIEKWKKNKYNKSSNLCPICRSELCVKYQYDYKLAVAQVDKNIPTGNIIRLPIETSHKMSKLEFNLVLAEQQMVVIKIISCKKVRVHEKKTEREMERAREIEEGRLLY